MAYEIPGCQISARLKDEQKDKYRFVKLTEDGLELATSASDVVLGVLQREGKATEVVPVMESGISFVEASAAITAGALVGPAAEGKAAAVTSGAYSGIAMDEATAAGDIISVLLRPNATKA